MSNGNDKVHRTAACEPPASIRVIGGSGGMDGWAMWRDGIWNVRKKQVSGRYRYVWHSQTWLVQLSTGRMVKIVGGELPECPGMLLVKRLPSKVSPR